MPARLAERMSEETEAGVRVGLAPEAPADPARMRVVVAEHFDFLWRSLRRLGVPAASVDDAAQRVFLIAARKLGAVATERTRAFLFAIALRIAAEDRRARRRCPEVSGLELETLPVDPGPSAEELTERTEARTLMQTILESMVIEQRAVFVLFEVEELSLTEIGALLELPRGTVASRLRRARETFAAAIARIRAQNKRGDQG